MAKSRQTKIYNQHLCLEIHNKPQAERVNLKKLIKEVRLNDELNREALAARKYFPALFGSEFKRHNKDVVNARLNYVYAIVRSVIRQNLVRLGLEPAFGINHQSEENPFNLSDDVIECFRPIVDSFIYDKIVKANIKDFTIEIRRSLPKVLLEQCIIDNKVYYLSDAIAISCESFNQCIENDNAKFLKLPIIIEGGR